MLMMMVQCMINLFMVLISVAFFSLFERKFMSVSQSRLGPNKVGAFGFFQPFSDMLKLFSKTESSPQNSISLAYYIAPTFTLMISLMVWILLPIKWMIWSTPISMMTVLFYFSISVYGVIVVGWFSNSKYGILGSVRAAAQSISYEVGLTMSMVIVIMSISNLNLMKIMEINSAENLFFSFLFLSLILGVILLAETNRAPFDLAEGESDLVSGFNVEYGGISYSFIYMSESVALLWVSMIWSSIFFDKAFMVVVMLFVLFRMAFPRNRFDKVMDLFWLSLLPITLSLMGVYVV
nr:NADH dehydrogenase subunit 1 [Alcedoecus sp.]